MLKKLNFIYYSVSIHYVVLRLIFIALQTYKFFLLWHKLFKNINSKSHFIFHSNKNTIKFTIIDSYHKKHFSVNKFCKKCNLC